MTRYTYRFFAGLLILVVATSAQAHPHPIQESQNPFDKEILEHLNLTYVTLLGGVDLDNNLKVDGIYYEAEFNINYVWWKSATSKQSPHHLQLHLPVRLQIRQFTSTSSPVRTPSYNPGLRVFYWNKSWAKEMGRFSYLSLGVHHYSNGQQGPHFNPDGSTNTETGSFSSEYIELAAHHKNDLWFATHWRIAYRSFLTGGTWEPEQDDQYPDKELFLSAHSNPFLKQWTPTLLRLGLGYKMGRDFVVKNPVDGSQNVKTTFGDNIQIKFEVLMAARHFKWKDIRWYMRYDYGYDYYNINYQKKMNRIQFGLVGYSIDGKAGE
ncbi:MAG: hypothetical protein ABGX83_00370 [Nitrospira sp.]